MAADGGPPDDLPDLPPGVGRRSSSRTTLSELADEAAPVRRELRDGPAPRPAAALRGGRARRRRRAVAGRPPTLARLPLLIMSMAVLATVASLFAVAWPGPTGASRPTQRTASTTDDRRPTRCPPST